jgi:phosphatidylserine synthase
MLGGLVVALLMVSQVPYPHLTKQVLRGRRHFNHVITLVLVVFFIAVVKHMAVAVGFWGYAVYFMLRASLVRAVRHEPLMVPPPLEEPQPQ